MDGRCKTIFVGNVAFGSSIKKSAIFRTRIFYLFIALLLLTVILYVYQVLNSPFVDGLVLVSIILFSVISVWFSFDVAKTIYLLHDKMIDNTFDQDIRSEIDQKGHGQNW